MTVCTHGNFIVLPNWQIRLLAPWPDIPLTNSEWTSPCPILLMPSAWLGSDKYQFYKSLIWLDRESNSRSPTHTWGRRSTDSVTAPGFWHMSSYRLLALWMCVHISMQSMSVTHRLQLTYTWCTHWCVFSVCLVNSNVNEELRLNNWQIHLCQIKFVVLLYR